MRPVTIFFLLIFLLGRANAIYAQKAQSPLTQALIDSLLKELPKQKDDTNKVNILNSLSSVYHQIKPDEGIKYGRQDSALAAKLDWKKGIERADNCLALNYISKADYPKALTYLKEALEMDEALNYKEVTASVIASTGIVYFYEGDYPKALEYFFKALKIYEEFGDKHNAANTTDNIGNVYGAESDYSKSLEYYFKALKIYEETGNKNAGAITTGNIGNNYRIQGDYHKGLEYCFKALKMAEEIGNKYFATTVTSNIGSNYRGLYNYTYAVAWHFKAAQMANETGNKRAEAEAYENIGTDYVGLATNQSSPGAAKVAAASELPPAPYRPDSLIPKGRAELLRKAVEYLDKAIVIGKEIGALSQLQSCYYELSTADSLLGDISGAYYAHIQYTLFKDSVYSKANNDKIAMLENDRKQYGDSLKGAAAKKVEDIKIRHRRNYEYIGVGVIALLIGFTFLLSRNNKLLGREKKRSEDLLLNILPGEVAEQLKDTGKSVAKQFDDVTVLFTDFVNFTEAGERMSPQALIEELDNCFKKFDEITGKYGVEKIKTIGDAYLAVAGLPSADPKHAENAVRAAIEINNFMSDRLAKLGERTFAVRIGIHSGSVVAGIVGVKKFAYDIWGDTVNTAARMEQNSEPGKINISETTFQLVKDKIACEYRGEIDAKGKGMLKMYYASSAVAFSA